MPSADTLVERIVSQTDILTSLSFGSLAAVLASWAALFKLSDNLDLSNFRYPFFLVIPAILFLAAIVAGYLINMQATGFYFELARGTDPQGLKISDPVSYFMAEYEDKLAYFSITQMGGSIVGVVLFSGWYAHNVFHLRRGGKP